MPKSKRNRQIALTQTTPKGREHTEKIIDLVRTNVDKYSYIYALSFGSNRTSKLSSFSKIFPTSRTLFGKNSLLRVGLGLSKETEPAKNTHKISEHINKGAFLLFSNEKPSVIKASLKKFSKEEYARAGQSATKKVIIPAGELNQIEYD